MQSDKSGVPSETHRQKGAGLSLKRRQLSSVILYRH